MWSFGNTGTQGMKTDYIYKTKNWSASWSQSVGVRICWLSHIPYGETSVIFIIIQDWIPNSLFDIHMEKCWSSLLQTSYLTKVWWSPFKLTCQYNLYKFFCKGEQRKMSGSMHCFKKTFLKTNWTGLFLARPFESLLELLIKYRYASIKIDVIP